MCNDREPEQDRGVLESNYIDKELGEENEDPHENNEDATQAGVWSNILSVSSVVCEQCRYNSREE